MSQTEFETLTRERNLYMGKYRALIKLVNRTRNKLVQVTDHIEDEGDRCYFGSTNHADELRELYHEMMGWIWDATDETNRMKSDPYADLRKQRARATKAEAENKRLRDALEFYADPKLYECHPHGIGFDRRDKSCHAVDVLATLAEERADA